MRKELFRAISKTGVVLLLVLPFVFSPVYAQSKEQGNRFQEELKRTKQDLDLTRNALSSLKALYAEKEVQTRDLKIKLDKINDILRRCQDSSSRLVKEKDDLSAEQSKVSLQLKQSEMEKSVLAQQNQVLANCYKENEAKTIELNGLRNTYARDKKDFLNSIQESESKLNRALQEKDALAQKKSELEVKYSVLNQQVSDIKSQQVNCRQQKEELALEVRSLQKEVDSLQKKLLDSVDNVKDLAAAGEKIKQQEGLADELAQLRRKYAQLENELKLSEGENKKLALAAAKYDKQDVSRRELDDARAALAKSEDQRAQLQEVCDKVRKQEGDLEAKFLELTRKLAFLQEENKKARKSREPVSLPQEKAAKEQLAALRDELAKCRDEKKKIEVECKNKEKASGDVLSEMSGLKERAAFLEFENKRLKEAAAVPAPDNGSQEKIARLGSDLQATKDLSYQLVQEKAGLIKRQEELNRALQDSMDRLLALEQEKSGMQKKNKELETEYAKLSEQVGKVMVQSSELEKQKASASVKSEECLQELRFVQDKLKASEQLAASLQSEVENLKKANKDLEVQAFNIKVQKEQEVALTKAQLEQLNALKEGEYVQLNNKFQEYRLEKDGQVKALQDSADKLKAELQDSRDLSFQMVQEKSSLQGQQKQASARLNELEERRSLLEQQKQDLEKQNVFLKNQYVDASQELDSARKELAALVKGRAPADNTNCRKELEALKSQLAGKDQEYLKKIKEAESKYKDMSSTDKSVLIDELAKLKNNYEDLQDRFSASEKARKDLEAFKSRYSKMPEETANLHYNLGVVYAQNKDYKKAVIELEKVIELKPNDAEAYYNLGVISGEYMGNRKKAIGYFEKYLSLSPNDRESEKVRRYILTWKTFGQEQNDK